MVDLNNLWTARLKGKKVIVTGGTTGIGRAITLLLLSYGADCFICGLHPEQIDETIQESVRANYPGTCRGIVADVSSRDGIELVFKMADMYLKGLDVLINNAALAYGSITEGNYTKWDYVIKTNLTSYLACCHHAVKRMEAGGGGHIINIGSMSSDVREAGSALHEATKSGIQGFTESLRKELNPKNIRLTLIEPGAADTDLQGTDKEEKEKEIKMRAEDVAMAVLFCLIQHERCDIISLQIRSNLQLI